MIAVMGLLGMVLLAGLGSFLVGKVGGAGEVGDLGAEIGIVFATHLEDATPPRTTILLDGRAGGLRVEIEPAESLRESVRRDRVLARIADFVFERAPSRAVSFVEVRLLLAGGKTLDRRFARDR